MTPCPVTEPTSQKKLIIVIFKRKIFFVPHGGVAAIFRRKSCGSGSGSVSGSVSGSGSGSGSVPVPVPDPVPFPFPFPVPQH
jgi:hypothetical protein